MRLYLAIILSLLFAVPASAKPVKHVDPLKGTHQALERQNHQADREHLTRLDEKTLVSLKKSGALIRIPSNKALKIDSRLPAKYRYVRPEVATFMLNLSSNYHSRWHKSLRINSAVRTEEYQAKLRRTNGNAARATSGARRSSHLTGATVDIAKKGMSKAQLQWMRVKLANLERQGRIEATEEYQQAVFHIMIFGIVPKRHSMYTNSDRPLGGLFFYFLPFEWNFLWTSRRCASVTCVYICVVLIDAWPSICCTERISAPLFSKSVANE